jgi:hypothetical protein
MRIAVHEAGRVRVLVDSATPLVKKERLQETAQAATAVARPAFVSRRRVLPKEASRAFHRGQRAGQRAAGKKS